MRNQISVLSVPIDTVTIDEAVDKVYHLSKEPGFHMVATANAEMVMMAQNDKELHEILTKADLVVPDGAGVLWAAEQKGEHFPERVAGYDLACRLCAASAKDSLPIYCLGAAPGVAEKAMAAMQKEFGSLPVVGIHDGYFKEADEEPLIKEITESGAKLVLLALGVPKQEKWMYHKLQHLDGVVAMGVGGSFDVMAGMIPRAPKWMQEHRLEWLYRLFKQPSRLMRMMALPRFMWKVKTSK